MLIIDIEFRKFLSATVTLLYTVPLLGSANTIFLFLAPPKGSTPSNTTRFTDTFVADKNTRNIFPIFPFSFRLVLLKPEPTGLTETLQIRFF